VAEAVAAFGRLDGLYHVAGASGRRLGDGPLHEITDQGWRGTLELNLTSLFNSNRAAARQFLKQGTGGERGEHGVGAGVFAVAAAFRDACVCDEQGGDHRLTTAAAAYYADKGIRFNAVAPGLVGTPMARRAAEDPTTLKYIATKQPLDGGRIGKPDDADAAVVYFLSDASAFVTGQVLAVDGGWSVSEGQMPTEVTTPWAEERYAIGVRCWGHAGEVVALMRGGQVRVQVGGPTEDDVRGRWKEGARQLVEQLESEFGRRADWIGVCGPGIAASSGNSIWWMMGKMEASMGFEWAAWLGRVEPVPVFNDAQAALLAETRLGAARGAKNVVMLTLGTGRRRSGDGGWTIVARAPGARRASGAYDGGFQRDWRSGQYAGVD